MTVADAIEAPPLRRLPVPEIAPRPALQVVASQPPAVAPNQGTLALSLAAVSAVAVAPDHGPGAGGDDEDFARPRPTPVRALPEPRRWAAQFARAAIEVASGVRPASQLIRWTSDEVQATLARRAVLAARAARSAGAARSASCRVQVRSARVCIPQDGVAEVSLAVSDGVRVRAVALRLEGLDGRWRVTAFELG